MNGMRRRVGGISARLCKNLQREILAPSPCGPDQGKVILRRNAAALLPSGDRRVGLAKIGSQVGHGRPDMRDVLHATTLRILRIAVNTHIVHCGSQDVYLGLSPK